MPPTEFIKGPFKNHVLRPWEGAPEDELKRTFFGRERWVEKGITSRFFNFSIFINYAFY